MENDRVTYTLEELHVWIRLPDRHRFVTSFQLGDHRWQETTDTWEGPCDPGGQAED